MDIVFSSLIAFQENAWVLLNLISYHNLLRQFYAYPVASKE